MEKKEYYTVKEISKLLNLSRQAIHKRIISRKIDIVTFGKTKVVKSCDLESVTR